MRRLLRLVLAVMTFAVSSAAHASVDRRYIEMPFGPGPGERALPLVFSYSQDAFSGSSRYGLLSLDFEYQNSISDEFALVWAPLPLGLIIRDPEQVGIEQSAFRWSLGLTEGGLWGLKPRFTGSLRRAISNNQAYEIELEYFSFFPFSSYPMIWTISLKPAYIAQLSDAVAVKIGAGVTVNDSVLLQTYDRQSSHNSAFNLTVPVSLTGDFRLSQNVHLEVGYEFRGIGLSSTYRTHTFLLQPTVRW